MKSLVISIFFSWNIFILSSFSQNVFHQESGLFLKRVEHNMKALEETYNLDSKGELEKLLLGNFNASVEFYYHPSFEGASGFRVYKESLDKSNILKITYISNYREVISFNQEERLKRCKVDTNSLPISNQFAEILHRSMVVFIHNFKVKGLPVIFLDGYSVTFRVVVEDEVWSLRIHMPQGNAKKMSDLCRQIITDAQNSQFDESKYMSILNTFEFENK